MANSIFAMCQFFAVCIVSTDGKEVLCRQPADGKELADGKFLDSSSERRERRRNRMKISFIAMMLIVTATLFYVMVV